MVGTKAKFWLIYQKRFTSADNDDNDDNDDTMYDIPPFNPHQNSSAFPKLKCLTKTQVPFQNSTAFPKLKCITKTQVPFQNLHLSNHLIHISHLELKTLLVAKEQLRRVNEKQER